MSNFNVIKRIGKGSFSNVYLCKDDIPLHIDDIYDEFFIIKEINVNDLASIYMNKNGREYETFREYDEKTKRKLNKDQNLNDKLNKEEYCKDQNLDNKIRKIKVNYKFDETKDDLFDMKVDVNITPYEGYYNTEREYYFRRIRELVESEIDILNMIDHTNIINFYGSSKEKGIYYLRMEYCDGGDVYNFLKTGGMDDYRNEFGGFTNNILYEFLSQTVNGLKYIHDMNIIHRDIKLHNVLMKYVGDTIEFKITDFGFSCYDLSNKLVVADDNDFLKKKYYKLCGTPYYMAPEIVLNMVRMESIVFDKENNKRNGEVGDFMYDKRVDIWSLGICVYELMFNLLPFSNIKNIEELEKFYGLDAIQEILNKKMSRRLCLKDRFRDMMYRMICVDKNRRCNIDDISLFLEDTRCIVDLIRPNSDIKDIINCKENMYIKNEKMKANIVKVNVSKSYQDLDLCLSWQEIKKTDSMINESNLNERCNLNEGGELMNKSVSKGFLGVNFLNFIFN